MTGFELDSRLAADTHLVARWGLSEVLLMDDARFPWLILVPRVPGVTEWFDLGEGERGTLLNETLLLGKAVQAFFNAEKINTAALGNVVSQLHVHVVARYSSDHAWPAPVWGSGTAEPYDTGSLTSTIDRLRLELPQL
ncbi:MAG: HIT family protein [Luminiphilus sp.]|jgi:diadenosine tetraphosphate (Ap4A) HIT family hydrolase|nr:HIT family protein [Luminiphilus sp.]MDG1461419.1 HIT family protein [Luminiphilus sp.]